MNVECLNWRVSDAYEFARKSGIINMFDDLSPDLSARRISWCRGLPPDSHHSPHGRKHRFTVPPKDNRGRSAVPRNVRTGSVYDGGQIPSRDELLDQLLAPFALHKSVR